MLKHFAAINALLALPCLSEQADPAAKPPEREDAAVLRIAHNSRCQSKNGYVLFSSTTVVPRENDDMGEGRVSMSLHPQISILPIRRVLLHRR